MLNRTNLQKTLKVLQNTKQHFNMNHHLMLLDDGFFVGSVVGYAIMELDKENFFDNYKTPHLVTDEPIERYRSWAFDFYNVKHDTYDYLFSKQWAVRDNSIEGAIKRIQYVLEKGLPKDYMDQLWNIHYKLPYHLVEPPVPSWRVRFEAVSFRDENSKLVIGKTYEGIADNRLIQVVYHNAAETKIFAINDGFTQEKQLCKLKSILK